MTSERQDPAAASAPPASDIAPAPAFRFRITEADFRRAQWLHIKPRPAFAVLGLLVLALVLAVLAAIAATTHSGRAIILLVVIPAYLGLFVLYRRWRIGRIYGQMKVLQGEFAMTVDERGIHTVSARGQATMPYGDILRLREDERIMMIYHADNLFNLVPKSSPPLIAATELIREFHRRHLAGKDARRA